MYGIWTFGGWEWLVLPVILFLRGQAQPSLADRSVPHFHHVDVVLSVAVPAFFWLLLARVLDRPELFFPFAVALGVHLGVFEIARQAGREAGRSLGYLALVCGAAGLGDPLRPVRILQRLSMPCPGAGGLGAAAGHPRRRRLLLEPAQRREAADGCAPLDLPGEPGRCRVAGRGGAVASARP